MSRGAFSIPTVLRMVPNDLLRRFFQQLGHSDLGLSWDTLGSRDRKPVVAATQRLESAKLDEVEAALHTVFDLACDTGIAAIREAGSSFEGTPPLANLPDDATPYQQAMTAWLDHRDIVHRAVRIHQVENLTWWRKRRDLPQRQLDTTSETLEGFKQALSALLVDAEGRGRVCTVETMIRKGTEYVFAHLDDYAQNVTAHDKDGHLGATTFRQTFPIIFAFNPAEGTLETFAKLPSKTKPKVEALFAGALLGLDALPKWPKRPTYKLAHLKPRDFVLATDAADRMHVELRQVRFRYPNSQRQMSFTGDPQYPSDTHNLLDDALNQDRVPLSCLELTMVTLDFEFDDGREPRSVSLDVARPNSCSLRNLPPNRADMIQKYLRRWGIDDRPADGDLAEAG